MKIPLETIFVNIIAVLETLLNNSYKSVTVLLHLYNHNGRWIADLGQGKDKFGGVFSNLPYNYTELFGYLNYIKNHKNISLVAQI